MTTPPQQPPPPQLSREDSQGSRRGRAKIRANRMVNKGGKKGSTSFPVRYSYSGADCKAVAFYKEGDSVRLESLATISYSVYEAKSPVRRLGERTVAGYTKGIRTVAGSMVFLVIEDHPLAELVRSANKTKMWSEDNDKKGKSPKLIDSENRYLSTMLEPFNIGLFYRTEVSFIENKRAYTQTQGKYASGYISEFNDMAQLIISGVEIISEGMVTSVNDMVTEVTMQFVAHDVYNIEKDVNARDVLTTEATRKKYEKEKDGRGSENPTEQIPLASTNTDTDDEDL